MHLLWCRLSCPPFPPRYATPNFLSHDSQKDSPPTPPLLSAVQKTGQKKPKGIPLFLSAAQPTDQGEEGVLVVVVVVVGGGHFSASHVQFFGV